MTTRTPRVKFFPERRKDKSSGEVRKDNVPILFSLSYGVKRLKSTTGLTIHYDLWDHKNGLVVASHNHSTQINKVLSDLRKELEDVCYNAPPGIKLNNAYISGKLSKNQRSTKGFFGFFDAYITEKEKELQPSSIKKLNTIKSHLKEFSEKKQVSIEFDELDERFFNRFIDFLFEKNYINSYVKKNVVFVKSFLLWSVDKGFCKNEAFRKWKLKTGEKNQTTDNIISLTIPEFLSIYKYLAKNEAQQRAKDYLILSCSTGLRFSDIQNLKKSDVDYEAGIINCTTVKTGDRAVIPFNDFSREILDKYRYSTNLNAKGFDMAFPAISNQKTNDALKELASDVEINSPVTIIKYRRNHRLELVLPKHELITTHTGRKTFVTLNVALQVSSEVTMGLTTHKSHATMERYYSVNLPMKQQAMKKFSIKSLEEYAKN
ncbi:MAG TPA: site-specific integrase [Bacteroidales bacterium]|mgnify:CR=1 FL=1|nr:site-specific integrase [Bacteroidales bacterium]